MLLSVTPVSLSGSLRDTYFVVTSATVGHGAFFPVSTGGHLVGVYVIVGDIVTARCGSSSWPPRSRRCGASD